jgi:hypothetical protein
MLMAEIARLSGCNDLVDLDLWNESGLSTPPITHALAGITEQLDTCSVYGISFVSYRVTVRTSLLSTERLFSTVRTELYRCCQEWCERSARYMQYR